MKDILDRMKEDSRYNAAIKLALYSLFVVFAMIFIIVSNLRNQALLKKYGNVIDNEESSGTSYVIELPSDYSYIYRLVYNDKMITYSGNIDSGINKFSVTSSDDVKSYMFLNNNYYLSDGDNLIKTSLEEVYNIIPYSYFNIETINTYIKKINDVDGKHVVYVKDIVDYVSNNEFISFEFGNNNIKIDYTNLLKLDHDDLNNCTLYFEYDGKE